MTDNEYQDTVALLALSLVPGVGSRKVRQIASMFQARGRRLAELAEPSLETLCRKVPEMATRFPEVAAQFDRCKLDEAERCLEHAHEAGMQVVHYFASGYPARLLDFLNGDAPPLLFLRGAEDLLAREAVAVVGTRSPSRAGIEAARQAAAAIVNAGFVVVSGGAMGVDRAAHDAALEAGGATLAFLPQGIATYDLSEPWHRALQARRLLLASEYLPEAPWRTYAAVSRNALIAARASAICVIEPRKQGGSILTARHGVEQGKPVLCEPLEALTPALRSCAAPLDRLSQTLDALKEGGGGTEGRRRPGQSDLF